MRTDLFLCYEDAFLATLMRASPAATKRAKGILLQQAATHRRNVKKGDANGALL